MQKTQAGQSWPLGPRTIPGGTSPSSFFLLSPSLLVGSVEDFEERSTGCWLWTLFAGDVVKEEAEEVDAVRGGDDGLVVGTEISCCCWRRD